MSTIDDLPMEHPLTAAEAIGVMDAYSGHEPHRTYDDPAEQFAYLAGYWKEAALEFKAHMATNGDLYWKALEFMGKDKAREFLAQRVWEVTDDPA